jgi:hypothetical protein
MASKLTAFPFLLVMGSSLIQGGNALIGSNA